jgi:hypothetical protein
MNRAKDMQRQMKDAQGDIDAEVKIPWTGKTVECTYQKLTTRDGHWILYSCLLPAMKCLKKAFEEFGKQMDAESDDAKKVDPFAIVEVISGLPEIVSADNFYRMAEKLLAGMYIEGKEIGSLDDFGVEQLFEMYLFVFHGIRVNFPFSSLIAKFGKSKSTTSSKARSNEEN